MSNANLNIIFSSKTKEKVSFVALCYSKKIKNIDDFLIAKETLIVDLHDLWFIAWGKASPDRITWVKKAINIKKKLIQKKEEVKIKLEPKISYF